MNHNQQASNANNHPRDDGSSHPIVQHENENIDRQPAAGGGSISSDAPSASVSQAIMQPPQPQQQQQQQQQLLLLLLLLQQDIVSAMQSFAQLVPAIQNFTVALESFNNYTGIATTSSHQAQVISQAQAAGVSLPPQTTSPASPGSTRPQAMSPTAGSTPSLVSPPHLPLTSRGAAGFAAPSTSHPAGSTRPQVTPARGGPTQHQVTTSHDATCSCTGHSLIEEEVAIIKHLDKLFGDGFFPLPPNIQGGTFGQNAAVITKRSTEDFKCQIQANLSKFGLSSTAEVDPYLDRDCTDQDFCRADQKVQFPYLKSLTTFLAKSDPRATRKRKQKELANAADDSGSAKKKNFNVELERERKKEEAAAAKELERERKKLERQKKKEEAAAAKELERERKKEEQAKKKYIS